MAFWNLQFSIRISQQNIPETISYLEKTVKKHFPHIPFSYYFLDEYFDRTYKAEIKTGQLYGYFAVLAIVLACMGLFGLSTFIVENRINEIGIRKVFGASTPGIVFMFSKDFLKILIAANIFAVPLVYYVMNRWLENFAYRISIGATFFIITALVTIGVAFVTISSRAVKAALSNPAETLRSE